MANYLTATQVQEIETAAVNSGLILRSRLLLFRDIRPSFVGFLPITAAPRDQWALDVAALNAVEKLEDGSVPLAIFLRNAAEVVRDLPESRIFQKYENLITNRSGGVVNLAPVATLPASVTTKEAIIHQDDTVDLTFVQGCLSAAPSIGKMVVPRYDNGAQKKVNGAPWVFNGTGWLITKDLVITNHHVINSRRDDEAAASDADFDLQARNSRIVFDYDVENGATVDVAVASVVASDLTLDYCILRLAAPVQRSPLKIRKQPVAINATSYVPLNIIQHPYGKAKRFALRNNLAVDADQDIVRYYTDTDSGSSGSPVFDDQWQVVALHRGAVLTQARFQGKDTAFVNVGSQISRIGAHVTAAKPAVAAEIGF